MRLIRQRSSLVLGMTKSPDQNSPLPWWQRMPLACIGLLWSLMHTQSCVPSLRKRVQNDKSKNRPRVSQRRDDNSMLNFVRNKEGCLSQCGSHCEGEAENRGYLCLRPFLCRIHQRLYDYRCYAIMITGLGLDMSSTRVKLRYHSSKSQKMFCDQTLFICKLIMPCFLLLLRVR